MNIAELREGITLHWLQVGAQYALSPQLLEQARIDVAPMVARQLVASVRTFVLQERLAEETQKVTLKVPATWWDMLKRDHLPMLAARWPVRYRTMSTTVTIERDRIYPDANLGAVFGRPVHVDTVRTSAFKEQ